MTDTDIDTDRLARSILAAMKAIDATVREHAADTAAWSSDPFDRWASLLQQIPELEDVDFSIENHNIDAAEFKLHIAAAIGFLDAYLDE